MSEVTLKQIVETTGLPRATIYDRCKRESWPSCGTTVVNHNETKLYAVAELPADIQRLFNTDSSVGSTSSPQASSLSPFNLPRAGSTCLAGAGILQPTPKTHPHPVPLLEGEGVADKDNSIASPGPAISSGPVLKRPELLTPAAVLDRARLQTGEVISIETGEVVNMGTALRPQSEEEIEMEIYTAAAEYNRKKADEAISILTATAGMKGAALGNFLKAHPEINVSYQTVLRLRKARQEMGVAGLLGKYGSSAGSTKVQDDHFAYYKTSYLKEGAPSVKSCWMKTLGYARSINLHVKPEDFPSPAAFDRRLEREIPESAVYMARFGKDAWNKKYANYIDRDYSALKPGEVIVSDHAQVDVAVLLPGGKVCFPWVTAWRCFKTSKWLGWLHHPEAPNSDHVFQSFYYACEFGLSSDVYIDNGKDYRVRDFAGGRKRHKVQLDEKKAMSMLALLGITPHFALPYNAQTKPIERDFLRNKEWFSKHMPGYRGGNVTERPEVLADEIKQGRILHWDEYMQLMDIYITTISNKMPVDGKVLQGRCPDEVWEAERTEARKVSPDALKLFCMRTSGEVTIGRNGIRDSKLDARYWAEWMSGVKGLKVYIRRDIKAHQTAWVFRADNDEFLGKAELVGQVAALARTDVEKETLKIALARKQQEKKIARAYFSAKDAPKPAEAMAHMSVGVAAINQARGYTAGEGKEVKVLRLANTQMDQVIHRDREMQRTGTYDLSAIQPPEPNKQVIYLFESDKE